MSRYLFDTSALLVDYFHEPGWPAVKELLRGGEVRLSAPTVLELLVRTTTAGVPREQAEEDLARYLELLGAPVVVDQEVARRAWELRAAAQARLPTVDALIAACAAAQGATLVHRDPHFAVIPAESLGQLILPAR